jgi:thiamine-phosphate pyrophosphorylase
MSTTPRLRADALRLVAVTDSLSGGIDGLARRAAAAVEGGATMLTLRLPEESARTLTEVARALRKAAPGVPLLVSDRVDVALAVNADGVHVGGSDLPAAVVRRFAPSSMVIGASVGAADEVSRSDGADFVAIGPVFAASGSAGAGTTMGVARFSELARLCGVPAIAVGGVAPENVGDLMAAGAVGVAVISALFGADDPTRAARALRAAVDANGR